jgi:hypothetical protein
MFTHADWYHVVDKMKLKCSIVAIDPIQGHYVSKVQIGFEAFFDMQSCDYVVIQFNVKCCTKQLSKCFKLVKISLAMVWECCTKKLSKYFEMVKISLAMVWENIEDKCGAS